MSDFQKKIQESLSFEVQEEQEGLRLDQFLAQVYPELSRSYLQRLVEEGYVFLDGREVRKPSKKLKPQQNITLHIPEPEPLEVLPEDIPLEIVYEDEHLLVLIKPCGLVVHPSPGYTSGTLVNALLYHVKELSSIGGVERPGIVHRLDRNTMGLMVVAKTDTAHRRLAEQFKERRVEKLYRAIVKGLPDWDYRFVEAPIGRHEADRKKFSIKDDGKPAKSEIWVLERFFRQGISLLKVKIHTGRTHQIRVHLSSLGFPVLGDTTYGFRRNSVDRRVLQAMGDCHMLLSYHLSFEHPATGEKMSFQIEDQEPFKSTLALVKKLEEEVS
ncbi:MAG: RluA family pseudouridine synthase [Aquificaceae bacterium]|jgi:23S rRNA pseudouridine1911/1915/1917 synthase|uniref:RluA family pseudouridine synthase n=1 Tax=Hydrogenobacter sp. Uz 6-8 TaxID=3384828 RepID=UPI000F1812FD|nr:MAG: RluA family pseudouridine synthase [Aquificota bacterium]